MVQTINYHSYYRIYYNHDYHQLTLAEHLPPVSASPIDVTWFNASLTLFDLSKTRDCKYKNLL